MSPTMKPGGHQQGQKATLVLTVPHHIRALVEAEARNERKTMTAVATRILAAHYDVPEEA